MIKLFDKFRLHKSRNQVIHRLGRNIYNFGLVERWLKYIVTVSDVAVIGSTSGPMLDSKTKKKAEKVQRMMLGQLINEVFQLWAPGQNIPSVTQDLFDLRLKTSMKIEMRLEDYQALKTSYETMIEDRNFLIHQFNEEFTLSTVENCHKAITYLNDMREKHLPVILNLQEIVKTYLELAKDIKQSFE